MLQTEKNYDFRKRMLKVHEENIRDFSLLPIAEEFEIKNGITILIPKYAGDVILTAAQDFADYLLISMNTSAMIKRGESENPATEVSIDLADRAGADLGDAAGYKGFKIEVEKGIKIYGFDERGAAQALYYLENIMNARKAPFIKKETIQRKPMFSPRMVHSGYGLDNYPNEHLSAIAHAGRDAILLFVKDVNITPYGFLDFNELIYRAAKYGIDVYAYSYYKSKLHSDDEGAEEYYENTYGRLFKTCPGLKGVILVGESIEFPSKDKNVSPKSWNENIVDGIPTGKLSPGWWPCEDYVEWLNLLKRIIRKYNGDAEIIFWTYGWDSPDEARIKLIESLPTDITLLSTFEICDRYPLDDVTEYVDDYTLSYAGPCRSFKVEAAAAKRRGLRLYSMTNTGGLTWDIGVIPYQPMPYQWIKRYEEMKKAHEQAGLCGIMESHHFGFYPSFIGKLSNYVFLDTQTDMAETLMSILGEEYGAENAKTVDKALKLWSDAITHYAPTDNDQYGAFRVGPSQPFTFIAPVKVPSASYAMFGNGICYNFYDDKPIHEIVHDKGSPISIKINTEIKSLTKMKELMDSGIEILESIVKKNKNLLYLINLGKFISRTVQTGIHAKQWHKLKSKLKAEESKEKMLEILDTMERLLKDERENAEAAIPIVEADSRLGWEPSMEYMTDKKQIIWKIRQVDYVINTEIKSYKVALNSTPTQ